MNANRYTEIAARLLAGGLCLTALRADECRFTYTYEPEVLPQRAVEFEQWVTLRSQRTSGGHVQRMLTKQLRELEQDGLVNRKAYLEVPPRVEYSLTVTGKTFIPILRALCNWGKKRIAEGEQIKANS